jgi:exosortase/archaeosortase family protein
MKPLARHPLARFLLLGLGLYAAWFVLYDLWLLPDGRLDAAVSRSVAVAAGGVLGGLGLEPVVEGRALRLPGTPGVYIADGCNGLSSLGLFVGFVLAYPGAWRRRAWFLPLGLAVVYATNVLRVVGLAWLQRARPEWFDALHGFGATTVFYVAIFALWVAWTRLGDRDALLRRSPAPVPAQA